VEDGFYCRYEEDNEKCWKFLSYSGSIGAGGEADCEQKNVLPAATGPNKALAKTRPAGQQTAQTPAAKTETPPKQPAPTPKTTTPKTPLGNLGTPTGTGAPKIQFTAAQTNFTAQVGQRFSYSFCQPALTRASDLCTAAATNPKNGLPPYSFSLESGVGFLPYGLVLNLNGLLEGTPTAEGARTVGICAKDTGGFSVCRRITISVNAAAKPLTISIDSVKCEFISHTTPWDPNPYWAIYKITASGSISSANQQIVVIDIGGEAYEQPIVSCGSWSANIEYRATGSSGPGSAQATCAGTGNTNWQY
jgi:hypothetical protein